MSFNQRLTCLFQDVRTRPNSIPITIKLPKVQRGSADMVDLFMTLDLSLCLVSVFLHLKASATLSNLFHPDCTIAKESLG